MKLVRIKYERKSVLKRVAFLKEDKWDVVKRKIASAYGEQLGSPQECKIIVSEAELAIDDTIPTLGMYFAQVCGGAGRTVFGLYIPDTGDSEESLRHGSSYQVSV